MAAVLNVLRSEYLTQGPVVPAFEQAIADRVGAMHGIAVNSATFTCYAFSRFALRLALDLVHPFVASANCGRYCGAISILSM